MSLFLTHQHFVAEKISGMRFLEQGYDGEGGLPLKRKALRTLQELMFRRPDITLGCDFRLTARGGMFLDIFRGGREVTFEFDPAGHANISACTEADRGAPECVSATDITEGALNRIAGLIGDPHVEGGAVPVLGRIHKTDEVLDVVAPGLGNLPIVRLATPTDRFEGLCFPDNIDGAPLALRVGHGGGIVTLQPLKDLPVDVLGDLDLVDGRRVADMADDDAEIAAA